MTARFTCAVVVAILASIAVQAKAIHPPPSECRSSVVELDKAFSSFDECASAHSQPFGVCLQCASDYERLQRLFYGVMERRTTEGKKCWTLVNGSEITILITRFARIEDTWNTLGACGGCFAAESFNISATVRILSELRDQLWSCENGLKDDDSFCFYCASKFYELSEHFDRASHVEKATGHRMCLDMVVSMNKTRAAWSDRCDDPVSRVDYLIAFLIVTSSLLLISCIFIPGMFKESKDDRQSEDQKIIFEYI